jgi:large subunit ribosomal protein L25
MHPVRDTAVHVDFLELNDKKPVKVSLPVRVTGAAPGVLNGGKLRQPYRMLRVIGLPGSLPEEIMIDISTLKIGDSIRVSELKIEGMEFNEPANAVVIGVKMARGAAEEEAEEEAAAAAAAAETAEGGAEEAPAAE